MALALKLLSVLLLVLSIAPESILAQGPDGTLQGQVTDTSGAVVPGAVVQVTNPSGSARTASTNVTGTYSFTGLPSGRYTVSATHTGFAPYSSEAVEIAPGRTVRLPIRLELATAKQEVTVQGETGPTVSTEAANNAGAVVLKAEELDALSDDPDELAAELQALAGPSAGPTGGQIYVDGFTAGRLPPKSSIREIRINQNPFSAEFDRLGSGRIEVLTKPGSDKYRGESFFEFGDSALNSRNPYFAERAPFQQRLYGGDFSGPLNKRASFFLDLERREIDDDAVVHATILDPLSLEPIGFSEAVRTPNRYTSASPRVDYQLSPSHTLTARYRYTQVAQENAGVGTLTLASEGYNTTFSEHVAQLTETAVLSARAINETRFQFTRTGREKLGSNADPGVSVLGAFTGGGAQVGRASNVQDRWELHNSSTVVAGLHGLKFGVSLRHVSALDISPQNFGGSFTFSGGTSGPALDANGNVVMDTAGSPLIVPIDSLERYRRTLLLAGKGVSPARIRELGGGASLFTLAAGDPRAGVRQFDLGAFLQEDWRLRPNLTISLGFRYEAQTNIHGLGNVEPRMGIAWAPGKDPQKRKTVLRAGFGIFYNRVGENLTLQAARFNGLNQQQFIISDPDFFPVVPPADSLTAGQSPVAIWRIASNVRAPYSMQSVIGIERQLPFHTTVSTSFSYGRGEHLLLSRNINAPLPGTYLADVPGSGTRPYGPGDIFQYESSGVVRHAMWMTNMHNHITKRFALFAMYGYGSTKDDTDGAFPGDQYNLAADYGRSVFDMRHHFEAGGSVTAFRGIRVSPIFDGHSGMPFNITSGLDLNGDGLFTDRPAFATDLSRPGVVRTPYGLLDPNPPAGAKPIPRNFAQAPGLLNLGLRVSRSFAFGDRKTAAAGFSADGFQSVFGDAASEKRFGLTVSASARNLLNSVNANTPVGVLTSPLFLQSQGLAWNFGPAGASANRRIELQVRLTF
jgi:hypothetical protein